MEAMKIFDHWVDEIDKKTTFFKVIMFIPKSAIVKCFADYSGLLWREQHFIYFLHKCGRKIDTVILMIFLIFAGYYIIFMSWIEYVSYNNNDDKNYHRDELRRFNHVRLSVNKRISPRIFEIFIWNFGHVLLFPRNCSP